MFLKNEIKQQLICRKSQKSHSLGRSINKTIPIEGKAEKKVLLKEASEHDGEAGGLHAPLHTWKGKEGGEFCQVLPQFVIILTPKL